MKLGSGFVSSPTQSAINAEKEGGNRKKKKKKGRAPQSWQVEVAREGRGEEGGRRWRAQQAGKGGAMRVHHRSGAHAPDFFIGEHFSAIKANTTRVME